MHFIFCSPPRHTIQTVSIFAHRRGLPIKLDWGLSEFLKADWFEEYPALPTTEERHVQYPKIDVIYQSMIMPQYYEDAERLQDRILKTITALIENFGPNISSCRMARFRWAFVAFC
ncbi:MAG: histidine phosphatase family protein [Abditibacteriaceae bacterium]